MKKYVRDFDDRLFLLSGFWTGRYMCLPIHVLACQKLDYNGFTQQPLMFGSNRLRIYYILDILSKTNATVFASVWLPLLDLAEIINPNVTFEDARKHLQG